MGHHVFSGDAWPVGVARQRSPDQGRVGGARQAGEARRRRGCRRRRAAGARPDRRGDPQSLRQTAQAAAAPRARLEPGACGAARRAM